MFVYLFDLFTKFGGGGPSVSLIINYFVINILHAPLFLSKEFVVCREMLDEEVKRRRAELLKKFRLDSDRIPIRSDFEKNAPAKAVKIPEPPNFGKSTAAAPPPPISNPASAVEGVSNMWHKLTSDTIKVNIDTNNENKIIF